MKIKVLCSALLIVYIAGIISLLPCKQDAMDSAIDYNLASPLSRQGTVKVLMKDDYSKRQISYALDNLKVDWRDNAAKRVMEMPKGRPRGYYYDRLVKEGFTGNEIDYALKFKEGNGEIFENKYKTL